MLANNYQNMGSHHRALVREGKRRFPARCGFGGISHRHAATIDPTVGSTVVATCSPVRVGRSALSLRIDIPVACPQKDQCRVEEEIA